MKYVLIIWMWASGHPIAQLGPYETKAECMAAAGDVVNRDNHKSIGPGMMSGLLTVPTFVTK